MLNLNHKQTRLLTEALLIAEGKSLLNPSADHLKALLAIGAECRTYSQIIANVQRSTQYQRSNQIAVEVNGLSHEELEFANT